MNKKTIRIAGWALGLSMAVAGIGAAVGASQKGPIETKALGTLLGTYTLGSGTVSKSNGAPGTATWDGEASGSALSNGKTFQISGLSNYTITDVTVDLRKSSNSNSAITLTWKFDSETGTSVKYGKGGTTLTQSQATYDLFTGLSKKGDTFTVTTSGFGSTSYGYNFKLYGSVASSDFITDLSVSPSSSLNVNDGDPIDVSGYVISGSKNGAASAVLSSSDYIFQGSGTGIGDTFVSSSTTNYTAGDTRLQWKSKYPTTQGGSVYSYAGISLNVKAEQVEYVKVTDDAQLEAGKKYLLVEEVANNTKYYAMAGVTSSLGECAEITLDTENHKIGSKAARGTAVEYTLGGEEGAWTLYGDSVYLSYSGSSNNVSTSETASTNNQKWTIDTSDGTIANKNSTSRKLQFNYNNGNPRFACYTSSQTPVFLYERIDLEPALTLSDTLEAFVGQSGVTLTATPSNYEPDTFVWTSSDETVATVSGTTATGSLTLKKAGTTNIKITASKDDVSVEKTCVLTVKPAPSTVNVKVGGNVVDQEYVLERIYGGYKQPTVEILPAEANQNYTLTVQSESIDGAFVVDGKKINYVKENATGVIRVASAVKPSVYFDLNVKSNPDIVNSIEAMVAKDFYVGDTITKSDITLTATYEGAGAQVIDPSNFDFENYTFTYSDAPTGGSTKDVKSFDISFGGKECKLDVNVGRKAYQTPSTTLRSYNGNDFYADGEGIAKGNSSAYAENQSVTIDEIEYSVSGYVYNSNISISSSSSSAPGHIKNVTPFPTAIAGITLTGASPDIQVSANGTDGWIDYSESVIAAGNYRFFKVFFKETAQSGYVNISNLSIRLKGAESARTLADFVMYEDTDNQCVGKFSTAKSIFESLDTTEKAEFMTGSSDLIATARARFLAWAAHEGKTIELEGGDYVIKPSNSVVPFAHGLDGTSASLPFTIAVASAVIATVSGALLLFHKRRKED